MSKENLQSNKDFLRELERLFMEVKKMKSGDYRTGYLQAIRIMLKFIIGKE